jgi:hypothetical protein
MRKGDPKIAESAKKQACLRPAAFPIRASGRAATIHARMAGDDLFHLLLANADDHAPLLPDGLPASTAAALVEPEPGAGDEPDDIARDFPQRSDVPTSRWGLVVPEGPAGDRLLALAKPLIALREAQQGGPAPVYRVPVGLKETAADAMQWRADRYDSGAGLALGTADYQLILGDLADVPLAIQQLQSIDARVGRVCFADEAGYAAYFDKILRSEASPRRGPGRVVLHAAHDGSAPLDAGWKGLIQPGEALLRDALKGPGAPPIVSYGEPSQPGLAQLLDSAGARAPGVLLSVSHGQGAPFAGWRSRDEQRKGQGAMIFGTGGQLTGDDLASRPFMPDGLWLMFACFGAGTPGESAFAPWLDRLQQSTGKRPPDVRRSLALGAPFIADLPQRVLANPDGPLAFIGHIDLAWTFSFREGDDPEQSRAGRFIRVLRAALSGALVGDAYALLSSFVRQTDYALSSGYAGDAARAPAAAGTAPPPTDPAVQRAVLWMTRQDLAGFILLGDPAASLPVGMPAATAPRGDGVPTNLPPSADGTSNAPDPMEQAIGEVLSGRSVKDVATARGIDAGALERAVAVFRDAGRRALSKGG